MKSLPKVKFGLVGIGSKIAQNHSSGPWEVKSGHYLPQFTYKVDQNVKLESARTLLRITHLTIRKSYLIIICPNSQEKLTKSEIRSSWSQFEHCSESLVWSIESYIWSLFGSIHMKSLPKVKLGQVQVGSTIAQNHSSSPYEVISGHYLPQFTWKVDQK